MTPQKRALVALAGVCVAGIGFATLHGGVKLKIDADKKNVIRNGDELFDPEHPPAGAADAAGFAKFVPTAAGVPAWTAEKVPGAYCTYKVSVTTLTATLGGGITVFLPSPPGTGATEEEKTLFATLKAHEEGHATIDEEVFQLVAQKIAEAEFKAYPDSFSLSIDPCTKDELQRAVTLQLRALFDPIAQRAMANIVEEIAKVNAAFDAATTHGQHDPGDSEGSAHGQKSAAKDAVKDFKQSLK